MDLDLLLEEFPKEIVLRDGAQCTARPLTTEDEAAFLEFFKGVPSRERLFIKHRVTEPQVIHHWCQHIDYSKNLPLLGIAEGKIVADATLHQQQGGWKRHIGRISVLVLPDYRGQGLAKSLVMIATDLAREIGLEKLEAEFLGEQEAAIKMFALLGYSNLLRLPDHVKDMDGNLHDYILMGLDLRTDEEYAGMG